MGRAEEYSRINLDLHPVQVLDNVEISPGVFLISWKQRASFIPGQVVKVALDQVEPPRIYSICSGNIDEKISVLFNIKEDGYLTPRLATATTGDNIWVSDPYGSFHADHTPAFWIATGTGIAPFYSMFQSGLADRKILIHGARHLNQFYFDDELEWALGDRYIRCCSAAESDQVFHGRVTDYLIERNHYPIDYKYYICGKSLMVVDVRDLLISNGIPFEKIFAEIYF